MNAYKPITDKDITRMMNMPAICDLPCIDIYYTLRDKIPDKSYLAQIRFVYKWGYLQGKRDITDWHGQTKAAATAERRREQRKEVPLNER